MPLAKGTGLCQRIHRSPVWREKDDLLRSVPGVVPQVSLTLLAYLPPVLGTPPWSVWHPSEETAGRTEVAHCMGW